MTTIPTIVDGGESFFYRGGETGCLCLHGFTASPAEVRWLGGHLAGEGLTVYGPRLPGHATDYRDLSHYRWQDWYAASLDGLKLLRSQCKRVLVVGHSMGGLLALLLGATTAVDGLVVMAAPVLFRNRQMAMTWWLKYPLPYTDQTDRSKLIQVIHEEQTRRGEPTYGRIRYNLWSTAAVGELYRLSNVTRERLGEVKAPLMAIYSAADRTVAIENRDLVVKGVGSAVVEVHTLQTSDHILPQDVERETVFRLTADFIRAQSNPTG